MKIVLLLLLVSTVGSLADDSSPTSEFQRQLFQRSNELFENDGILCIYVDLSETGSKIIVCGAPAPATSASDTIMTGKAEQPGNPEKDETFVDDHLHILSRLKKDVKSASAMDDKKLCVYADPGKTGKKTIVCGDPAPPTLDMLLAAKSSAGLQERQVEERTLFEKCFGDKKQTAMLIQQPHFEQPHYEQVHYIQPQVHLVQPQVHYVQPQVHYVQPQVHYVQPQIHYVQPQVHYEQPQLHYEQIALPKPLCDSYQRSAVEGYDNYGGGYGDQIGYGGSYYGRSSVDDYPMVLKTVETDHYVNDVPVMRSVQETAIPLDELPTGALKGFSGQRTAMRPTPIFLPQLRNVAVADDQFDGGLVRLPTQYMENVPQVYRTPVQRSGQFQFDGYYQLQPQMQPQSQFQSELGSPPLQGYNNESPNAGMYNSNSRNVDVAVPTVAVKQQPAAQSDQLKLSTKKIGNDRTTRS